MVNDVRHKVSMRVEALLKRAVEGIAADPAERQRIALAQTDFDVARALSADYRAKVVRAFPGCTITFARGHLAIQLPDRYTNNRIPIIAHLPPLLIECFSPRGLSNAPF